MNKIDLYHVSTTQWKILSLKNYLTSLEWDQLSTITHRQTFRQKVVSRALLRYLLQKEYGLNRESLVFDQNDRGKPLLKSHPDLCFNNSHSHDKILIGVTKDDMIGVDIEFIQSLPDEEEVAKRFFSPREFIQYKAYKLDNEKAFFMFWTAKEAVIKAFGKALWEADQVPEVGIEKNIFSLYSASTILSNWTIDFPNIDERYVACVAVNCPKYSKKVYLWNFQPQIY